MHVLHTNDVSFTIKKKLIKKSLAIYIFVSHKRSFSSLRNRRLLRIWNFGDLHGTWGFFWSLTYWIFKSNSFGTVVAYKTRESMLLKGISRYLNSFPTISSTSRANKILELYRLSFNIPEFSEFRVTSIVNDGSSRTMGEPNAVPRSRCISICTDAG